MLDRRSFLLSGAAPTLLAIERATKPLKIVCVGAHPDDPESGCGGTLARYGTEGHKVIILYLTRGERGIPGKSLEETAALAIGSCRGSGKVWSRSIARKR